MKKKDELIKVEIKIKGCIEFYSYNNKLKNNKAKKQIQKQIEYILSENRYLDLEIEKTEIDYTKSGRFKVEVK